MILVDDNPRYREPTVGAGYKFLLVTRDDDPNRDKSYLIKAMEMAGLTAAQIVERIIKCSPNEAVKKRLTSALFRE
ncbi:hypothetical protein [Piscirickettsia litoralis]|uniref:Response regulatory domain-containing protein n=1 Tax=Piscirickettsia litoralis TaxID=1891921 RepID=A0ABX2ZZ09_9GAMM|nr:hypothetical protein [Piscirickettsia litoralis]ODN41831.1 hypothetical protein BGC07_01125 [Piscirickettsia litoralis]